MTVLDQLHRGLDIGLGSVHYGDQLGKVPSMQVHRVSKAHPPGMGTPTWVCGQLAREVIELRTKRSCLLIVVLGHAPHDASGRRQSRPGVGSASPAERLQMPPTARIRVAVGDRSPGRQAKWQRALIVKM